MVPRFSASPVQGEFGPLWFLSKERIDPESLGFKGGEAAFIWLEYWAVIAAGAAWIWLTFVDKDQKTERYWDVRAVKEFKRQFQTVSRFSQGTVAWVLTQLRPCSFEERERWFCAFFTGGGDIQLGGIVLIF